jgi:hypothetical protein
MARTAGEHLPAAIAEGGLLWVVTVVALDLLGHPGKTPLATSLALLTLVPIVANRKIARTFSEEELFSPTLFARYLDRADAAREYRVLGESLYPRRTIRIGYAGWDAEYTDAGRRLWIHQTPALWGRGMVFNVDFDAGDLSRVERLRKLSDNFSGHTNSALIFGSLSLRWGVRFRDQNPPAGFQSFRSDSRQAWDENREALPHVRLAEAWTEETSALAAGNAIQGLRPREIVVETGTRRRGRRP